MEESSTKKVYKLQFAGDTSRNKFMQIYPFAFLAYIAFLLLLSKSCKFSCVLSWYNINKNCVLGYRQLPPCYIYKQFIYRVSFSLFLIFSWATKQFSNDQKTFFNWSIRITKRALEFYNTKILETRRITICVRKFRWSPHLITLCTSIYRLFTFFYPIYSNSDRQKKISFHKM